MSKRYAPKMYGSQFRRARLSGAPREHQHLLPRQTEPVESLGPRLVPEDGESLGLDLTERSQHARSAERAEERAVG